MRVLTKEVEKASKEGTMSTIKRLGKGLLLLDLSFLLLFNTIDYVHGSACFSPFCRFRMKHVESNNWDGGWFFLGSLFM